MDCKTGTLQIIGQIKKVLDHIEPVAYSKSLEVFNGSTLGQHFRHIFDFYHSIFKGWQHGVIDYAQRERNPLIEISPDEASLAFNTVIESLDMIDEKLQVTVHADFSNIPLEYRPLLQSTYGRELMFAHDHAIHHLALIKIGLKTEFPQIPIEQNLGVAPSTLRYKETKG